MPLGKGVKYRWIERGGQKIRLAFRETDRKTRTGKRAIKVVETKKLGQKAKMVGAGSVMMH